MIVEYNARWSLVSLWFPCDEVALLRTMNQDDDLLPEPEEGPEDEPPLAAAVARPQEQLLLDWLPELVGNRVLCNTAGRAQFAYHFASGRPQATVRCFFWDRYQQQQAVLAYPDCPASLDMVCVDDPPPGPYDLAVLATDQRGEAELTRETLQSLHQRLTMGGCLVATTNNPKDTWLEAELRKLPGKLLRRKCDAGVGYWLTKNSALRKVRSFTCELAFRDQERLIHLQTRPGVFAHRRVDPGARRLMEAMEVHPGMQVLDLGCGSGAVGLAAASRSPEVHVWAVDSNARAVSCVRWACRRNIIENLQVRLDADGSQIPTNSFDLVLANPPYYSQHRIAEIFVRTAHRALSPQGRLLLVTKHLAWYEARLPQLFGRVEAWSIKGYLVIAADEPFEE